MIQAATNKSELFNRYAQWVAFGSSGLATAAERDEQRKMVKYNHPSPICSSSTPWSG